MRKGFLFNSPVSHEAHQNRQALSGDKGQREVRCASWHNSSCFDASSIIIQARNGSAGQDTTVHHVIQPDATGGLSFNVCDIVSKKTITNAIWQYEAISSVLGWILTMEKWGNHFQHCMSYSLTDLAHLFNWKRSTKVLHLFLKAEVLVPHVNAELMQCQYCWNM